VSNGLQNRSCNAIEFGRRPEFAQKRPDMRLISYKGLSEFVAGVRVESRGGTIPGILDESTLKQ